MNGAPTGTEINPTLRRHLGELRGVDTGLLTNVGNRGDGLIHWGASALLAEVGLQPRDARAGAGGEVLLVIGAGGLGCYYDYVADEVLRLRHRYRRTVILPSSFDLRAARVRRLLRALGPGDVIYTREQVSEAAVRSARLACQVEAGEDLSLHADLAPWRGRHGAGSIAILRTDRERLPLRPPPGVRRLDASAGPASEVVLLLEVIADHAHILTDRAHAAFAGALLGRQVTFWPNAYFKNRALYETSLRRYPNVAWVGDPAWSGWRTLFWLPSRARLAVREARQRLADLVGSSGSGVSRRGNGL